MRICCFEKQLNKCDLQNVLVGIDAFQIKRKYQLSVFVRVRTNCYTTAFAEHFKVDDFEENTCGCIVLSQAIPQLNLRKRQKRYIFKQINCVTLYSNIYLFGL